MDAAADGVGQKAAIAAEGLDGELFEDDEFERERSGDLLLEPAELDAGAGRRESVPIKAWFLGGGRHRGGLGSSLGTCSKRGVWVCKCRFARRHR